MFLSKKNRYNYLNVLSDIAFSYDTSTICNVISRMKVISSLFYCQLFDVLISLEELYHHYSYFNQSQVLSQTTSRSCTKNQRNQIDMLLAFIFFPSFWSEFMRILKILRVIQNTHPNSINESSLFKEYSCNNYILSRYTSEESYYRIEHP